MKRLELNQMEVTQGGDLDAACGFFIGVGTTALASGAVLVPNVAAVLAGGTVFFCGLAALTHIKY